MRTTRLGSDTVGVIGLGTWQFGSREWGYGRRYGKREAKEILTRALELGVNLIDTAEVYGFGRSESILGEILEQTDEKPLVATKLFPIVPIGPVVMDRIKRSICRLRLRSIDLYQIHWPNPLFPASLTLREIAKARDAGLVRYIGVSNFSLARWRAAEEGSGVEVISNQVRFSLLDLRPLRSGMIDWAAENGRLVIAYSPLGQGVLSLKYRKGRGPLGFRRLRPEFSPAAERALAPLFEAIEAVASRHGASPSQVALAWVVSHPNVVAIPGATSVGQLEDNVAAGRLALEARDVEDLTEAAKSVRIPRFSL